MLHNNHNSDLIFTLAYLASNKTQRRWLLIISIGIPLCFCLAFLWLMRPYHGITSRWEAVYPITGSEGTPLWDLKEDDFVSLLNDRLSAYDVPALTYLKTFPSDGQRMLTDNGESWIVLFHICPEDAVTDYWWRKYPEIESWLTNLEDVELDLYRGGSRTWEIQEPYVRCLISIFTPGAEDYVIGKLKLPFETSGIIRVKVDNVLYTRTGSDKLLIEPEHDF